MFLLNELSAGGAGEENQKLMPLAYKMPLHLMWPGALFLGEGHPRV